MTEREANEQKEELVLILQDYFRYADEVISRTNRARQECVVWQSADLRDLGLLADAMLRMAMRSGKAAQAVRGMIVLRGYVAVGVVLGPRFLATVQFYADNGGIGIPIIPVQGA